MPVSTPHEEFKENLVRWFKMRQAAAGEYTVKKQRESLLPRLGSMDNEAYERYLLGAKWYGATGRTISAFQGMIHRLPVRLTAPNHAKFREWLKKSCTVGDESFEALCLLLSKELLTVGRVGLLVDYSNVTEAPYIAVYPVETVINWRSDKTLQLVVLQEEHPLNYSDPFAVKSGVQYRVLKINEAGVYEQELWRKDQNVQKFVKVSSVTPTISGDALDYIPFIFINHDHLGVGISAPPLEAVAAINYHHYLLSADRNWGLHFIALPTPWVTGLDSADPDVPRTLGPTVVWYLPTGSQAGMLTYTGEGLQELDKEMQADKQEMADLGARVLETRQNSAEAFGTVRLKASWEGSALSLLASVLSEGLTQVLAWISPYFSFDWSQVLVEVNQEFLESRVDPSALREVLGGYQAGVISLKQVFQVLEKQGIALTNQTYEEYVEDLTEDAARSGVGLSFREGVGDDANEDNEEGNDRGEEPDEESPRS